MPCTHLKRPALVVCESPQTAEGLSVKLGGLLPIMRQWNRSPFCCKKRCWTRKPGPPVRSCVWRWWPGLRRRIIIVDAKAG